MDAMRPLIDCCLTQLPVMSACIQQLLSEPPSPMLTRRLLSAIHLIKQQALACGSEDLIGFVHVVECVLQKLHQHQLALEPSLLLLLQECLQHISVVNMALQHQQPLDIEARVVGESLVIKLILIYLDDEFLQS